MGVTAVTGGRGVWIQDNSTLPTLGISPPGVLYMNFSAVKRSLNVMLVREGVLSMDVKSPMP